MEVIPAIDLRKGLCVRLYQGDFNKETVYSRDPPRIAHRWQQAGAPRLHIVDLDGTRTGVPSNIEVIKKIAALVNIPLQVGGGIRSLDTAQRLLDVGIGRVVLGTAAIENPELVHRLCQEWGSDRVVVAVDARGGRVSIKGWIEDTPVEAGDLVQRMADLEAKRFLYTDIGRDGTLTEPNFDAIEGLVQQTGRTILASGGVSSLEHIRRLTPIGVEGVVIGSALYQGNIDLSEAIIAATT